MMERVSRRRQYKIEKTGATLTYHSALTVLARYASSLVGYHFLLVLNDHSTDFHYQQYENNGFVLHPHFVISHSKGMYECEVILPESSPIRGLIGKPEPQKSLAKQAAAFETCILLRNHHLLDDHFISTFHRRLPAMRNAKLSIKSKKKNQYQMMTKPLFWKDGCGIVPSELHLTLIIFLPAVPLQKECRNMILLTRRQMPQMPEFPLYLECDIPTTIRALSMARSLSVTREELELMTKFTLRIFQELYNKLYEMDQEAMAYWLIPATNNNCEFGINVNPSDIIDWNTLRPVIDHLQPDQKAMTTEDMTGRFAYDPWDGKYRYFLKGINKSLRPSDPPPSFLPRRKYMTNIMEYGLSLFKKGRIPFLEKCDWDQPVYDAEMVPLRRNLLDKMSDSEKSMETKVVLCLETQVVSTVSPCSYLYPIDIDFAD